MVVRSAHVYTALKVKCRSGLSYIKLFTSAVSISHPRQIQQMTRHVQDEQMSEQYETLFGFFSKRSAACSWLRETGSNGETCDVV